MARLQAGESYTCPSCGAVCSAFRIKGHRASKACHHYTRCSAAYKRLQDVGGYVKVIEDATILAPALFGHRRPTKVLAAGLDDLGHLTIVDAKDRTFQLLHGEWAGHGRTAKDIPVQA